MKVSSYILDLYAFFGVLSFKFKTVGGGLTCQNPVRMRLVVMGYSEGLLYFLSFKFKVVGGGPTASNFLYSLRSPYGAPFRRSANYAVQQQKK